MSAISDAFDNITSIIDEVVGLMPSILELIIAIVPIVLILVVVGWLKGWFKNLSSLMKFRL
jgi:hypothetical protein